MTAWTDLDRLSTLIAWVGLTSWVVLFFEKHFKKHFKLKNDTKPFIPQLSLYISQAKPF